MTYTIYIGSIRLCSCVPAASFQSTLSFLADDCGHRYAFLRAVEEVS